MKCVKHFGLSFAVLVGVIGVGIGHAPEAKAQSACHGKLVASQDIRSSFGGDLLGRLQVYYRPENNGTNIACVIHYGKYDGVELHTSVAIRRCDTRSFHDRSGCGRYQSKPSVDEGFFRKYAGPAVITNTNHKCVSVYGHIQIPRERYANAYTMEDVDCGMRDRRTPSIKKLW